MTDDKRAILADLAEAIDYAGRWKPPHLPEVLEALESLQSRLAAGESPSAVARDVRRAYDAANEAAITSAACAATWGLAARRVASGRRTIGWLIRDRACKDNESWFGMLGWAPRRTAAVLFATRAIAKREKRAVAKHYDDGPYGDQLDLVLVRIVRRGGSEPQ